MALLRAASVDELRKPGKLLKVKGAGKMYVLVNSGGSLYCLDGTCMKEGCMLAEGKLEGHTLTCPWHGAEFDVRTGFILRNVPPQYGIATNLRTYRVLVQEGEIFIDI
jgi:3-phenylpropionate/trans-cinnamate dioxygenase ferredoxin subunit